MSFVALVTDRFDDVTRFYGERLGFPVVEQWDRTHGRGRRFDLGGLRLEILDNQRVREPLDVGAAAEKVQVVVEVDDVDAARARLDVDAPPPTDTSWGARLFQLRDPDGVPVTFLQWIEQGSTAS